MSKKTLADKVDERATEGGARVEFVSRTKADSERLTAPLIIRTTRKPWWDEDNRILPKHAFIPDTQIREGVPLQHLRSAALYLCSKKPDVIVLAMDWFDFPSLSFHDQAHADFRTRSVMRDFRSGLHGWDVFMEPIRAERARSGWNPLIICIEGNHDARLWRHLMEDARTDQAVPTPRQVAEAEGCLWYPFLTPVDVDGILYCHYFVNPMTGRPYSGQMETRLKTIGRSFTMGHQQTYMSGVLPRVDRSMIRGLVAGSFYMHDEEYRSHQANHHWRGILIKHAVKDGNYNLMEVDTDFLLRRCPSEPILARGDYLESELGWDALLRDRLPSGKKRKK